MKTLRDIPGLRVKIRRVDEVLVATIWSQGVAIREVLRAPVDLIGEPGSEAHHAFADAAGVIVRQLAEQVARESGLGYEVVMKRRRPDYGGEQGKS